MTSKEGVSQFYGLPDGKKPHAVTSTSDARTFSYDAAGNRVAQTDPSGTTSYTFDAEQRLARVTKPDGASTSFVYDGDGGRVKQISSEGTTRYLGEAYEIAPDSTKTKYVFAGSLRIAAKDSTGSVRFYHGDHLGSSNVITDGSGAVAELAEYSPYGSLSRREGPANVPQKFTGQRLEPQLGLYLFPARAYDPQLGRFIQPDPFVQDPSDPQTLNRYSYVRNNPLKYVDPSGNFFWFVVGVLIAALFGGVIGGIIAAASGQSFFKGFLVGAAVTATFAVTSAAMTALLPALIGEAAAASALGQLGIQLTALTTAGALSGGVGSVLQGGSFGQGALVGGITSAATFGIAKIAGPIFNQLAELIGPKLAQVGEALANSSVAQQLSKFLNKVGLGSQGASSFDDAFNTILKKVDALDFSTGPDQAVFYSGPRQAARAQVFAQAKGKLTIGMTKGGQQLLDDPLFQSLSAEQQDLIWQKASVPFARGASGKINAFIRGARPDRTFRTIEEPILDQNSKIYGRRYHY